MKKVITFLLLYCCVLTVAVGQTAAPTVTPAGADALLRSGKLPEALVAYKALLQRDPKSAPAYAGLARVYLKQDQIALAHDIAHQGVEALPGSSLTHTALGEVDFREGRLQDADAEFVKALNANPASSAAYLGLVRYYDAISMYAHERDALIRAHDLNPDDPDIQRRWFSTLSTAERIADLESYLARSGSGDEKERHNIQTELDILKARQKDPGKGCRLASKQSGTEVTLEPLMTDPEHMRGWGTKVSINGHGFRLILDTGASGITLSARAAGKSGLAPGPATEIAGIGDKGPVKGYISYADSIKVGDLEFQNCLVEVSTTNSIIEGDGLIGADVFSSYLVTLDFPGRKMKLSPLPSRPDEKPNDQLKTLQTSVASQSPSGSTDAGSAQTDQKGPNLPKDRYIAPEMKTWTPVFRFGHNLLINTKIGDLPGDKLFLIDTGSSRTLVSPQAARAATKVNSEVEREITGLSGKVEHVFRGDRAVLQFAHFRQENQGVLALDMSSITSDIGTEISGILGITVLGLMEIKIDYRDGLVDFHFDPNKSALR